MRNLSLHPLWHTAMPAYQHTVGLATHAVAALAFYLMLFKTPKSGRAFARYLMLLQASITLTDFNFGFLFCPIALYPVPGAVCHGVLCTIFGVSGHVGISLLVFTVAYAGVSIILCFHFKYISISAITNNQTLFRKHRHLFRATFTCVSTIPGVCFIGLYRTIESGPEYLRINCPSLEYLFENDNYRVLVYDPRIYQANLIIFASTAIIMVTVSNKTRVMQRRMMWLLVLQVSVPLTIQLATLVIQAYSMIAQALTPDINNCIFCFQMTHALVHTITMILSTPSYRAPLLVWRRKKTTKIYSSSYAHAHTQQANADL